MNPTAVRSPLPLKPPTKKDSASRNKSKISGYVSSHRQECNKTLTNMK